MLPPDPLDARIAAAFNEHQRRLTPRGRLLGPAAVEAAVEGFRRNGAEVVVSSSPWQLGATLFTLFGVLALTVAGIGVYSSVSYAVSQRTHEFGVRAALGATARDVIVHVLGSGLRTVFIGIAVGVGLALAAGRLVASLLYGVKPDDPRALIASAGILLVISTVATLAPAWRASRVDPVEALRAE